jgi:hypothetical protein
MTYDEIAAVLGCSRRQVGYHLARLHELVALESPPGIAVPEEQET